MEAMAGSRICSELGARVVIARSSRRERGGCGRSSRRRQLWGSGVVVLAGVDDEHHVSLYSLLGRLVIYENESNQSIVLYRGPFTEDHTEISCILGLLFTHNLICKCHDTGVVQHLAEVSKYNEKFIKTYTTRGKPDASFALFESESLKRPGFVEFDDGNGKVLPYSAQDR
ncbi:hypothetical protein LguiB_003478 [Lonicera macranthoides]